jgi:hypothetical protein
MRNGFFDAAIARPPSCKMGGIAPRWPAWRRIIGPGCRAVARGAGGHGAAAGGAGADECGAGDDGRIACRTAVRRQSGSRGALAGTFHNADAGFAHAARPRNDIASAGAPGASAAATSNPTGSAITAANPPAAGSASNAQATIDPGQAGHDQPRRPARYCAGRVIPTIGTCWTGAERARRSRTDQLRLAGGSCGMAAGASYLPRCGTRE